MVVLSVGREGRWVSVVCEGGGWVVVSSVRGRGKDG